MKVALRVLVAGVALLLVGGWFFGAGLVRSALERAAERALGVDTEVGGVGLGLRPAWLGGAGLGHASLSGLEVANPEGFEAEHFLVLERAALEVAPTAFLADAVEIPRVELEGIRLALEQRGGETNYGRIMDHLQQALGEEQPAEPGEQRSFVVRELRVSDLRASIDLGLPAGELEHFELRVPELVLRDVGAEGSLSRLVGEVVSALLAAVLEAGADRLPAEVLEGLGRGLEGLEDQLERLGREAGRALEQTGEELRETLERALPGGDR